MNENFEKRLSYLLDYYVGTAHHDAAIRSTIGHAVGFARLCMTMLFILHGALFLNVPIRPFAVGAFLVVIAALLGFVSMQFEQLARLNDREADIQQAAGSTECHDHHRAAAQHRWRMAALGRAATLVVMLASFIYAGIGLYLVF